MHISSRYAKIEGKKLFQTWEIRRSESKLEDGEKKKERKRPNDGKNKGQATHGAHKPPGPTYSLVRGSLYAVYGSYIQDCYCLVIERVKIIKL